MKTKSDIIYKLPLFASLAALLICVPLRIYQYFKILEPDTGFYSTINFSVYIIYFLLAAAMIIEVIIPMINKKKMIPVASSKKSPAFLVVSLILAVSIIADSAIQLMSYLDLYEQAAMHTYQISEYISKQGGTILLLQSLSGAVAAIYFFVSGLSVSLGNDDGSKLKVLALTPVLWCIFKLLYRFKRTISFVNVSDLLFELFEIVFLMLFFLALAQTVAKIDVSSVFWKLYGYGIPAAMFALVCFLPRFIVMVTGRSDLLNAHHGIAWSDLGIAVYIIYNLLARVKARTAEPDNATE